MLRVSFIIVFVSLARIALATPVAPTLRIGSAEGIPGDEVTVTVGVDTDAAGPVLELFNELSWDALTPVRKLSNGEPDCFADIRVVPNFSSFTCIDESCASLHAEVLSQGQPLADGPVYGCIFVIDPTTPPGEYPLRGGKAMWGDAERQPKEAFIEDGLIRVFNPTPTPTPTATPTAPVSVGIRANDAPRGSHAELELDFVDRTGRAIDTGFDVVLEDVVFDLEMIGNQCQIDERLGNHLLTVVSLGNEDVPLGFHRIRFNVVGVSQRPANIPSGHLATCTVSVRSNAPLGSTPLDLQRVFANDSVSLIPGIVGIDGSLTVTTDETTATPTTTPTVTPTPMPLLPCAGDCDKNGSINVYEVLLSIRVAQEQEEMASCESIDINRDGLATVDELVISVGNLIDGCPTAGQR